MRLLVLALVAVLCVVPIVRAEEEGPLPNRDPVHIAQLELQLSLARDQWPALEAATTKYIDALRAGAAAARKAAADRVAAFEVTDRAARGLGVEMESLRDDVSMAATRASVYESSAVLAESALAFARKVKAKSGDTEGVRSLRLSDWLARALGR